MSRTSLRVQSLMQLLRLLQPLESKSICINGLTLPIGANVIHPAPIPYFNFISLMRACAHRVSANDQVLELGAGAGVWTVLAAQRGATCVATELQTGQLELFDEVVQHAKLPIEICYGDLFSPIKSGMFSHIFFNPPFHLVAPKNEREKAFCGGKDGAVLKRFLKEAPEFLCDQGELLIILPAYERPEYETALKAYHIQTLQRKWLPLLGWVSALSLTVRKHKDESKYDSLD